MPTDTLDAQLSGRRRPVPGSELLIGAVDSHVHCAPHINRRTVTLFDAVRDAAAAGLAGLGLMDVFANTSGLAALANVELGHLGVEVFGGIILEPYVGGVSARTVETALGMGYCARDGARFVSLPCHNTVFVGRSEGRSPAFLEQCLAIPDRGPMPGDIPRILDLCARRDVVFNTGHLSGPEHLRVVEAARAAGVQRVLVPAGYLDRDEALDIAAMGAVLEYSFFVFSHATQVPQTMIDAERHRFALSDLGRAVDIIGRLDPSQVVLSSDSGALILAPPVEAFREFLTMLHGMGVPEADLRRMSAETPARLFGLGPAAQA